MNDMLSIDRYVVTTLMRDLVGHDHRPSAFLVYLTLLHDEAGPTRSHAQLAEQAGLSRRAVQDAIRHLERRGLVKVHRGSQTEAATLTTLSPWRGR